MAAPAPSRVTDRELQRFAEQTRDELVRLERLPLLAGRLVQDGPRAGAELIFVRHGLQRRPQGFVVAYVERAPGEASELSIYRRTGERWDETGIALYVTGGYERLALWVY
jgi:hypothetical protein